MKKRPWLAHLFKKSLFIISAHVVSEHDPPRRIGQALEVAFNPPKISLFYRDPKNLSLTKRKI